VEGGQTIVALQKAAWDGGQQIMWDISQKGHTRQTEQEDPNKDMFGHEHQMMLVIIFI